MVTTQTRRAASADAQPDAYRWLCARDRCGRYLGSVVGDTLTEPNGDTSALPCVRRCTRCGKRNALHQRPAPR